MSEREGVIVREGEIARERERENQKGSDPWPLRFITTSWGGGLELLLREGI